MSLSKGPNGEFEPRRGSAGRSRTNGQRSRSATAGQPEPPRWQPAYYGGFQPEPEPEPAPRPAPEPTRALARVEPPTTNETPADAQKPARRPLSTRVRAAIAGIVLLVGVAATLVFALRPGRQVVSPVPAAGTPTAPAAPEAAPPAAPVPNNPAPAPGKAVPPPGVPNVAPGRPAPAPGAAHAPASPGAGTAHGSAANSAPTHTVPAPRQPLQKSTQQSPADTQDRPRQQSSESSDGHRDDEDRSRSSSDSSRHDDEDTKRPSERTTEQSTGILDVLGSLLPGLG